jgi:MoxR-like ATPase
MTSPLECLAKAQTDTADRLKQTEGVQLEKLSSSLKNKIIGVFNSATSDRQTMTSGDSPSDLKIIKDGNNEIVISTKDLRECWALFPYVKALKPYVSVLKKLKSALSDNSILKTIKDKDDPRHWIERPINSQVPQAEIEHFINSESGLDDDSIWYFVRFLFDSNWSGVTKDLNRNDLVSQSCAKRVKKNQANFETQGRLAEILAHDDNLASEIDELIKESKAAKKSGENIIFYGAPGTGKSTAIKNKIDRSPNVTTVFHPDMQNSDFVGALKPAVDENGKVTYKFSPGPFAEALSQAYIHPDKDVYLVIEELNRAPAMAVFGELFQLLDRKDNGESVYGVSFPSEEFQAWLNKETNKPHEKIRLPSNFSIYASMNSADQGVYPLDTAFRRRWHQEYIHINWEDSLKANLIIIKDKLKVDVPWKVLGKAINDELEEQYPEDRLLGQRWINNRDIKNSNGLVPSKLLNYLWDDLLRHDEETKKKIFKPEIKRFGHLMELNNGSTPEQIFSDDFLEKIVP